MEAKICSFPMQGRAAQRSEEEEAGRAHSRGRLDDHVRIEKIADGLGSLGENAI